MREPPPTQQNITEWIHINLGNIEDLNRIEISYNIVLSYYCRAPLMLSYGKQYHELRCVGLSELTWAGKEKPSNLARVNNSLIWSCAIRNVFTTFQQSRAQRIKYFLIEFGLVCSRLVGDWRGDQWVEIRIKGLVLPFFHSPIFALVPNYKPNVWNRFKLSQGKIFASKSFCADPHSHGLYAMTSSQIFCRPADPLSQ